MNPNDYLGLFYSFDHDFNMIDYITKINGYCGCLALCSDYISGWVRFSGLLLFYSLLGALQLNWIRSKTNLSVTCGHHLCYVVYWPYYVPVAVVFMFSINIHANEMFYIQVMVKQTNEVHLEGPFGFRVYTIKWISY